MQFIPILTGMSPSRKVGLTLDFVGELRDVQEILVSLEVGIKKGEQLFSASYLCTIEMGHFSISSAIYLVNENQARTYSIIYQVQCELSPDSPRQLLDWEFPRWGYISPPFCTVQSVQFRFGPTYYRSGSVQELREIKQKDRASFLHSRGLQCGRQNLHV